MRLLVLVFLVLPLSATTYFISNSGSDAAAGTSTGTAWANSPGMPNCSSVCAATTLQPGDIVSFQAGGTWQQTLTPGQSGTSGSPITYTNYGSGAQPIISGANLLSSFTTTTLNPAAIQTPTGKANTVSGTSVVFTITASGAGHALFAIVAADASNAPTVSDNINGAWPAAIYSTFNSIRLAIFCLPNTAAGVTTITVANNGFIVAFVGEYRGIALSSVLDKSASSSGATASPYTSGNTATTALAEELLIGAVATGQTSALGATPTGSWTFPTPAVGNTTDGDYLGVQTQIVSSTGAYAATGTYSHATTTVDVNIVTIKSASAGTTLYFEADATAPNNVFRDGVPLTRVFSEVSLATGGWYYDGSNVWIFDNPSGHTITAATRNSAIVISNRSYITVSGLHATQANQFGFNMSQAITHNVTLSGITSDYNYDDGLTTDTDASDIHTGLVVQNSTFANNGSSGINAAYATAPVFTGNTLSNNGAVCSDGDCGGIYGFGPNLTSVIFTGNAAFNNGGSNGISGNGIWFDTCGSGIVVSSNQSHSNHFSGISIENTSGVLVSYNLTYSNSNNGIQLNGGTTGWVLANNLIYNNTSWGNTNYGLAAIGNTTAATMTGNIWQNNLSTGNTAGALEAILGGNNVGTGSGNIYTFNGFGVASSNFIQWASGVNYSTYAAWEAAAGNCGTTGCSNSMQQDPVFINTTSGDFRVERESPALGAGTFISGVSTVNPPNIGALGVVTPSLLSGKSQLSGKAEIQ